MQQPLRYMTHCLEGEEITMDLKDYRVQIDTIDRELVKLFAQRMEVAASIAGYKKEKGLPVLDPNEAQKGQVSHTCWQGC